MSDLCIPFVKMQATGNAFVVVDALGEKGHRGAKGGVDRRDACPTRVAVETADPHFAVGHDGLLVVCPSSVADFRQRMFNPDGTEDMCGNGLRCTAKYLHDTGRIGEEPVTIETIAGVRRVEVLESHGTAARVRAEVGIPSVRPLRLDVTPALALADEGDLRNAILRPTYVSFGTPHVVIEADHNLRGGLWERISEGIEHHPQLDERATATWYIADRDGGISARFWERSVGETLACGTGAAAAAAAALARGIVGGEDRRDARPARMTRIADSRNEVLVKMRGGSVVVSRDEDGSFHVTGDAVTVFRGTWRLRKPSRLTTGDH